MPSAPPHPSIYERMSHGKSPSTKEKGVPRSTAQMKPQSKGTCTSENISNKMSSSCNKIDLSTKSGQKRVPKRLPPPPPLPIGEIPVHPQAKPRGRLRPLSSIPLGSNYPSHAISDQFFGPSMDMQTQPEENRSRRSDISSHMYGIEDTQPSTDDHYQSFSVTQTPAYQPHHMHEYMGNPPQPLSSSMSLPKDNMNEEAEESLYALPIHRRAAVFNRQESAPAAVYINHKKPQVRPSSMPGGAFDDRQEFFPMTADLPTIASDSEPIEHVYHVNEPSNTQQPSPPHQYIVNPQHSSHQAVNQQISPYNNHSQVPQHLPVVGKPLVHSQAPCQHSNNQDECVHSLPNHMNNMNPQAQVPDALIQQHTAPSHTMLAQPTQVGNSNLISQTTGNQLFPKPKSSAQPASQLALVSNNYAAPQSLLHNMSNVPFPNNKVIVSQNNNKCIAANQILATFPGMSHLQTYSYTQQSSIVTIPEQLQQQSPKGVMGIPLSQSSPVIATISPCSHSITGPDPSNVKLLSQQPKQPNTSDDISRDISSQAEIDQSGSSPQQVQGEDVQQQNTAQEITDSQNENPISEPVYVNGSQVQYQDTTEKGAQKESISVPSAISVPVLSPQRKPRKPVPKPRMMKQPDSRGLGATSEGEGTEGIQRVDSSGNNRRLC